MKWGRKWGNLWGLVPLVENIRITDFEETPPTMLVEWDLYTALPDPIYHVYLDGKFYQTTTALSIIVQLITPGRHFVQLFATRKANQNEDLTICLDVIPGNRVKLTWTASASSDVNHYDIFWDEGTGAPFTFLDSTLSTETEFITFELSDATYNFRVDPVDNAGNTITSSETCQAIIAQFPISATDLTIDAYDNGTKDADFSFTESIDTNVTEYRVYVGQDAPVDYDTIVQTISAPGTDTFTLNLPTAARYRVALRAFNGTFEEDNVDIFVDFDLGGVVVDLLDPQPNIPSSLIALQAPAGTFQLICQYDAFAELGFGSVVNFYQNDGLGGPVNFTTIIDTIPIPAHTQGQQAIFQIDGTTAALTDGNTFIFAAKAATTGGRESDSSNTATGVADATDPTDIADLVCEAVNFEE